MIELTLWDYSNIISKLLIYTGVAAAIGGPFVAGLINPSVNKKSIINYIIIASIIGFIAVIINFFIQVGAFSETGLLGMFDTQMMDFLWQTAVGDSVVWRLFAYTLLGFSLFFGDLDMLHKRFRLKHATFILLYLATIFSFAYSFTFVGHSADIGGVMKWLIGFHVATMAWWIGALYPLWLSCKCMQPAVLYKLMCLWGNIAIFTVGLLVVCGISLLFLFFENPLELLTSGYGQVMLLKLTFVAIIFLIAIYHKLHLVEEVQEEAICHKLEKSIRNEMLIAVIILVVTATLSSVLGPISFA